MNHEECMGRSRSSGLWLVFPIFALLTISGCGGGGKAGPPLFAGKVTLIPSSATSLELGGTLAFTSAVQTASGTNLTTTITYVSSDTSILNVSPSGIACAGHWDALFTTCTGGNSGPVSVTATALGGTSIPTYVFVHPPIDNISVVGVVLNNASVQEPCLSQSQTMTLEAHAFSRGNDITASVGPFTWSASNPTVVTLAGLNNNTFTFPTNQVTATATTPGISYIYASASGATSTTFQQPTLTNSAGNSSPLLDFFATCPVQNIALEMGVAGSGQTNVAIAKGGTAQTAVATITDVMNNSSLPNTSGAVVLSKIPLTWTSSNPGAITPASSCTQSCALAITSPGAATITASCSPPTCNAGFPIVPASLATPAQITTCSNYFQASYPHFAGCQLLIPKPVYSSNEFIGLTNSQGIPTPVQISPAASISVVATGTPAPPTVFAASLGCAHELPENCITAAYSFSTSKASAGASNINPVPLNSFLFDPPGVRIYAGGDFGALTINPASFGTNTSAFTSLGTVNGKVLAVSANGNSAIFSDTVHTPNQVYVTSATAATVALSIPNASAAAFSPDGLKIFIIGGTNSSSLYVYSALQQLQGPIALSGPATAIRFAPNGAFAFIAESANGTTSANVTAFSTCTNQVALDLVGTQGAAVVNLPADPLVMRVLPNLHIDGPDSLGNPIPDGIHVLVLDATGFDILTAAVSAPTTGTLCPQGLAFVQSPPPALFQRIELRQQIASPANFFASPDGTLLYVANPSSSTILTYSFLLGATTGGIQLEGDATPLSSDMSVDGSTIAVAGSDGLVHNVSTLTGGADLSQISFPNMPDYLNPFCSITPITGPCTLSTVLVKP
jgi:hypothetical protein